MHVFVWPKKDAQRPHFSWPWMFGEWQRFPNGKQKVPAHSWRCWATPIPGLVLGTEDLRCLPALRLSCAHSPCSITLQYSKAPRVSSKYSLAPVGTNLCLN